MKQIIKKDILTINNKLISKEVRDNDESTYLKKLNYYYDLIFTTENFIFYIALIYFLFILKKNLNINYYDIDNDDFYIMFNNTNIDYNSIVLNIYNNKNIYCNNTIDFGYNNKTILLSDVNNHIDIILTNNNSNTNGKIIEFIINICFSLIMISFYLIKIYLVYKIDKEKYKIKINYLKYIYKIKQKITIIVLFSIINEVPIITSYNTNLVLNIFGIITKYLIVLKQYFSTSMYSTNRSIRISNMVMGHFNFKFIIKCIINNKPLKILIFQFITIIILFAIIINKIEIPVYVTCDETASALVLSDLNDLYFLNDWIWFVFITMTTIGYGDMVPTQKLSKIVTYFCMFYGIINISIMLYFVINLLNFSKTENNCYKFIKRIILKNKIKDVSSQLIQCLFSLNKLTKNNNNLEAIDRLVDNYMEIKDELLSIKNDYKELNNDPDIYNIINEEFIFINYNLKELENSINNYKKLINK